MNLLDDTMAEFGRSIGLPDLRLRAPGAAVLAMQAIGTLAFDLAGGDQEAIIISLSKPLSRPETIDPRALLRLTHHRARPALPVQLGTSRGELVAAVVVPAAEFTLPRIHEAIRMLDRQHQTAEGAA